MPGKQMDLKQKQDEWIFRAVLLYGRNMESTGERF